MSNTLLRMGLRRTQRDLCEMTDWAYGFYEGVLKIEAVRDRPSEVIDVLALYGRVRSLEPPGQQGPPRGVISTKRSKRAAMEKLNVDRVAEAIAEHERNRPNPANTRGSGNVQGRSHKTFMTEKPHPFNGIEGVVGLRRWIEKIEHVFEISKCAEGDKVMFAASTFKGRALTWWNENMYIKGFPERIKGNITSSKPTTLHDAINMAREMVEQAVQCKAARIRENNKKKWEEHQRNTNNNNPDHHNNRNQKHNTHHQQQNQRKEATRAYVAAPAENRGAEKSFVSSAFTPYIDIASAALNTSYEVKLADRKIVSTNTVLDGCTLVLINHIVMKKIVCIPLPNDETLKVQDERPEKDPRLLSCIKADEKKPEDIRIVRDFPEVFPDDRPGLPQVREIEFRIDLIPGALPVVRSPYRLAPSEMKKDGAMRMCIDYSLLDAIGINVTQSVNTAQLELVLLVSNDSTCLKSCLETVKLLKSQNEQLLKDLKKYELMVLGYKTCLKSVEERLEFFKKNESIYLEDIKVLKVKIQIKEIAMRELRKKLEITQKEKDGIQLNIEKLENASKSLNKLIDCQIVDNCKKGLGYENYNAVPPRGNFMPPTPDLSYIGLDEFVIKPVVENYKAKSSEEEHKIVRNNDDASIIEEWVSGDKKENGNPQMDLHDQGVIDSGCSRHMTSNMSYLTYYEEIDGRVTGDEPALVSIVSLVLSHNPIGGKIPKSLSNAAYLSRLLISNNNLAGKIPKELLNKESLKEFDVSGNRLTGEIPVHNFSFPAFAFSGNPGLCEAPLPPCMIPLLIENFPLVEEIFPLPIGNFPLLAENLPLVAQKITLLMWEGREKLAVPRTTLMTKVIGIVAALGT
nr:putative reverse transcriptase domain-containing protein [Tanacetum cinerariifolium]